MKYLYLHGLGQKPDSWNRVIKETKVSKSSCSLSLSEMLEGKSITYKELYLSFSSECDKENEEIVLCGLSLGESVEESLKKLKTDYLDLLLLHQPFSDYYGAWHALEDLYKEGTVRAIGVSNFYPDRLVDIASFANIRPMVNQVETHPHNQQIEAKEMDG